MGRPLKIAKSQAILTITDTDGSTEEVTVSQNLSAPPTGVGIIAGMPFVTATSSGGLTAGTTYYVLKVTGTNTFTVSATPLNANPNNTPVNLSTTTGTSVVATVGLVDSGFQNPDSAAQSGGTSTNPGVTYGVVGGNTGQYGKQVLTRVAIGINGTGTVYTSDSDANIFGVDTDFANTLSAGSALQVAVANINGSTDYINLGFISSITGLANIEISNATASGDFLTTVGDATDLIEDGPVVLSANIGGLTAGAVYFVATVANSTAFSVSLTPGGANVQLSDQNATSYAVQDNAVLTTDGTITVSDAAYVYANDEAGYIVRQKGKQKYLVTGGTTGLTAQCYTANLANTALTPNTMSIIATYANAATVRVQSLSDYNTELFTATSGPVATGNIVLANANPAVATFNTAYAANTYGGQPYPIVTINNA